MDWTFPILAVTIIVGVSWTAVRCGSAALKMTGLSHDAANFQALSAFFGVGYTTSEAELVVNHPVRRRIVSILIIVGNLGLASGAATIIVSLVRSESPNATAAHLALTVLTLAILWLSVRFRIAQRVIDRVIQKALRKTGLVSVLDYETLLHTGSGYCVSEVAIESGHTMIGKTLSELRLADRGILILAVHREDGEHVGAPGAMTELRPGDVVTVYGAEEAVRELARAV